MMTRDYQRQRAYYAELVSDQIIDHDPELGGRRMVNVDEAQEILDVLAASFDVSPLRLIHQPRMTSYGETGAVYEFPDVVKMPRTYTVVSTLLHEFAHHLHDMTEPGGASHGGRFTAAHLAVVEAWADPDAARLLRQSYRQHSCDIGAAEEDTRREQAAAKRVAVGTTRTRYAIRAEARRKSNRELTFDRWYRGGKWTTIHSSTRWTKVETAERHANDLIDRLLPRRTNIVAIEIVEVVEERDRFGWYVTVSKVIDRYDL